MDQKENLPQFSVLPRHVGIIMDGNGRWAQKRGLPRYKGHIEGARTFRKIGEFAGNLGIECLTFYAFSTENWKRPPEEVAAIMDLFREYLRELDDRKAENEEKGIKVNFIGDRTGIPKDAINYGGRQEILHSVQALAKQVEKGKLKAKDITEDMISENLYTGGLPDPDLIIRPSGEYRLSNFLLWQSAYSEFWYSDILWPDFTEADFVEALRDFERRNRRFGGV